MILRFVSTILVLALATNCAQKLSTKQKAALTTLAVTQGTVKPGAYSDPQSMTHDSAGTLGFVSGLGFGLIGGVVAAGAAAIKQSSFEGKYKSEIGTIRASLPQDLGRVFTQSLTEKLTASTFLGPKLAGTGAAHTVRMELTSYTLTKNADKTHSPALFFSGGLYSPEGKKLLPLTFSSNPSGGYTASKGRAHLAVYARNPDLLRQHFEGEARNCAAALARELEKQVRSGR